MSPSGLGPYIPHLKEGVLRPVWINQAVKALGYQLFCVDFEAEENESLLCLLSESLKGTEVRLPDIEFPEYVEMRNTWDILLSHYADASGVLESVKVIHLLAGYYHFQKKFPDVLVPIEHSERPINDRGEKEFLEIFSCIADIRGKSEALAECMQSHWFLDRFIYGDEYSLQDFITSAFNLEDIRSFIGTDDESYLKSVNHEDQHYAEIGKALLELRVREEEQAPLVLPYEAIVFWHKHAGLSYSMLDYRKLDNRSKHALTASDLGI